MGLIIYRPEYNLNHNIKAQKKDCLHFGHVKSYDDILNSTPFDEMTYNKLNENSYHNEYTPNGELY